MVASSHYRPPRYILREEVVAFFVATSVDPRCPACGEPNSEILVDGNDQAVTVSMDRVTFADYVANISSYGAPWAIVCECTRCGLYRYFSHLKIVNWFDSQKQGGKIE